MHAQITALIERHTGGTVAYTKSIFCPSAMTAYVSLPNGHPIHQNARGMLCPTEESALFSLLQNLRFLAGEPGTANARPISLEQRGAITHDYMSSLYSHVSCAGNRAGQG